MAVGSYILNAPRKRPRRRNKNKTATEPRSPIPQDDNQAPTKKGNRGAVVVAGVLHEGLDAATGLPRGINISSKAAPTPIEKNSELDVGFTADSPAEKAVDVPETEVVPIVLDTEKEAITCPSPKHEKPDTVEPKVTLEEHDNEREHDGGVKLDLTEEPPQRPEDDTAEVDGPRKITETELSETVDVQLSDGEEAAPAPTPAALQLEPTLFEVVLPSTPVAEVVEEPVESVEEPVEEPVEPVEPVEEPVEPVEPVEDPVELPVEEPVVLPQDNRVIEQLNELFEAPPAGELSGIEFKVLEPRRSEEETAVSIDYIVGVLSSCKDINTLTRSLESYKRVSKPGSQEHRVFDQLHQYTTSGADDDKMSTRSKRSIRSFFRKDTYPQCKFSDQIVRWKRTTVANRSLSAPIYDVSYQSYPSTIPDSLGCPDCPDCRYPGHTIIGPCHQATTPVAATKGDQEPSQPVTVVAL